MSNLSLRQKLQLKRVAINSGAADGRLYERTRPDDRRVTFADLKIRTKDKKLVQFTPNPIQEQYLDMLQAEHPAFDWRNGVYDLSGLREDILKARQQGMSTLWLAIYFCDTINNPLTQSIIMCHDAPTTEKMFKVVHRFWENLPLHKKRPKKYSSKREIEFLDNESVIYVGTAGGTGVGRGGTLNNLHLSERAFWPDGDAELGLLESVPAGGNATRETTANGLNHYYEERQAQKNGDSNFTSRFFGWNLNPEYRLAPDDIPADFTRTEEEETLAQAYDLDDGQLAWRRQKKKDLKEKFEQEYPINEDEAFLTSGNPYYDGEKLTAIRHRLTGAQGDPLPIETVLGAMVAYVTGKNKKPLIHPGTGRFVVDPVQTEAKWGRIRRCVKDGTLQVFRLPDPKRVYTIGADTAEGISNRGDHDFDSADVIDCVTTGQDAHLHGRWGTHEYGLILAQLGWFYNTALLGVERNNHGHAVINALLHHAHYPAAPEDFSKGLYFHVHYDEQKKPLQREPGWPTTPRSKYFALDLIEGALQSDELILRSRKTVAELLKFVKLAGGKAGPDGAGHDDCVSSLSIALAVNQVRPRTWAQNREMLDLLKERYKPATPEEVRADDIVAQLFPEDESQYARPSSKENPDYLQDLLAEIAIIKNRPKGDGWDSLLAPKIPPQEPTL
jgi:hypothetical protein